MGGPADDREEVDQPRGGEPECRRQPRLPGGGEGQGKIPEGRTPRKLRLAGHVLIEQHDEWDGADRRYFSEHSMKLLTEHEEVAIPELTAA